MNIIRLVANMNKSQSKAVEAEWSLSDTSSA